jgi:hypothetical protein
VRLRLLDGLLLADLAIATWEKIFWDTSLATLTLSNIVALLWVVLFVIDRGRDWRVPRASVTLAGFGLAFLAVILAGYFDLTTRQALAYWLKGVGTWGIHFLFLVLAVAHISRRGGAFFFRCLRWFMGGIAFNAAYGLIQLPLQAVLGINLDKLFVGPLTGGQGKTTGLNVFGRINYTQTIYRVNALTGDPNHLGVMLCVPVLLLLALVMAGRADRRLKLLLALLFVVQALTLSRSAALGDIAGFVLLLPRVRDRLPRLRTLLVPAAATVAVLGVIYASSHFVQRVIAVRLSSSGGGTARHFQFYELVPTALLPNPLFGMGFNTYAVFYQFITGDPNFSPHSFWIATLVETGMVGLVVYLVYFFWVVANADAMRRSEDPAASVIGLGLLAGLVGTAAANFFYLTMSFDYFFSVVLLTVAGAVLFAPAADRRQVPAAAPALPRARAASAAAEPS